MEMNKTDIVAAGKIAFNFFLAVIAGCGIAYVIGINKPCTNERTIRSLKSFQYDGKASIKSKVINDQRDQEGAQRNNVTRVRILCWILTQRKNFRTKADAVKRTWGRKCDILLFVSCTNDTRMSLPMLVVDAPEGRDYLWSKTQFAFRYVHQHYRERADWFLKADDDTFVVMENLRFMLAQYKTSQPLYFGNALRLPEMGDLDYMNGGTGYALSRAALDRLVLVGLANNTMRKDMACTDYVEELNRAEDWQMGLCMHKLGVRHINAVDAYDKHTMTAFISDFKKHSDRYSQHMISFHHVKWRHMYLYFILTYGIRVIDVNNKNEILLFEKGLRSTAEPSVVYTTDTNKHTNCIQGIDGSCTLGVKNNTAILIV